MLEFRVSLPSQKIKKIPKRYPELIQHEVFFEIIIDDEIFFEDHNFPIFEFLYFVNEWKKTEGCSFEYVSMETEDNPLLAFICENNLWKVYSPWQLFECKKHFTREQLINGLEELEKKILCVSM